MLVQLHVVGSDGVCHRAALQFQLNNRQQGADNRRTWTGVPGRHTGQSLPPGSKRNASTRVDSSPASAWQGSLSQRQRLDEVEHTMAVLFSDSCFPLTMSDTRQNPHTGRRSPAAQPLGGDQMLPEEDDAAQQTPLSTISNCSDLIQTSARPPTPSCNCFTHRTPQHGPNRSKTP